MIKKVSANHPSFKTAEFQLGLNVVMADRTKESTKKDSRNGLGKSTLIEIIHFCLGASVKKKKRLLSDALKGWEFSVHLEIEKQTISATRSVDNPGDVVIVGDTSSWPVKADIRNGEATYDIKNWTALLGRLIFSLPSESNAEYLPSFRSLISYFIRRDKDAFSTPFEHFRKQKEWDKQVQNAFLLGLAWEDASEMQVLKDREKGLADLKSAGKAGLIRGFSDSLGDLEARKVQLKEQVDQESERLRTFKVHTDYERIQADADRLTNEIHELLNADSADRRLLDHYEKSLNEERPPADASIEKLYAEAGVTLPGITLRRLEEVRVFHTTIIDNRRAFLAAEMERLRRECGTRAQIVKTKTDERAGLLGILKSHGALAEYTLIERRHMDTVTKLNAISERIENLKEFETKKSEVKIQHEVLQQRARRDYEERHLIRERAIAIFNSYSERLYKVPGKLIIDFTPKGFKFDVEIERSGSTGIENMKVFCYDLMLARLWAEKTNSPRCLIHDSTIFDGVDERQRAEALEMAAEESAKYGFRYICTLNSDYVPTGEFSEEFDLAKYIRLKLTDSSEEGCLLGIRF